MDVMIDLETLGTRPDAAIIQIGAVQFEPRSGGKVLNGSGFKRYVAVQDGAGSIDHSTIAWWLQEKSAAKMGKALETQALPLLVALQELDAWVNWADVGGVWSNGAAFDQPVLASAYGKLGRNTPWHYRASRCVRTLFALAGGAPSIDWTGMTPHDALDDAIGQAMQVQKAMAVLTRA